MFAFEVVVREVVADVAARGGDMIVSGHFEFGLEGSEPTFRECVVVAVVRSAHALGDRGAAQDRAVLGTRVLSTAIGVVDQARLRLAFFNGFIKNRKHEIFGHMIGQVPADNPSGEAVHEGRQIAKLTSLKRNV